MTGFVVQATITGGVLSIRWFENQDSFDARPNCTLPGSVLLLGNKILATQLESWQLVC